MLNRRHSVTKQTREDPLPFYAPVFPFVYKKIFSDSRVILDAEASDFGLQYKQGVAYSGTIFPLNFGLQYKQGVAYSGTIFPLNSIILRPLSISM